MAWHYGQYAKGLAELGHEVYYFEDSGEWPYNFDGGATGQDWIARDCRPNVRALASTMAYLGLDKSWAYRSALDGEWYGLAAQKRREVVGTADLLINVSGSLENPPEYREAGRLVYVDTDPVFTQIKLAACLPLFPARVAAHDIHFSFGECLPGTVLEAGYHWRPTRQPIVLSEWPVVPCQRSTYTTIMSWASFEPMVYEGQAYGQKDAEFRRFLELPSKVGAAALEVALGKMQHLDWETNDRGSPAAVAMRHHPAWTTHDLLTHLGWRVVDPLQACPDLLSYRRYIQGSKGEWAVAKNGYVVGQPGWFSDRSACYLASGRPVIVQDTGFASVLPVGEGILTFCTQEEAIAAIQEVEGNYARHALAARCIAEDYFDSRAVLLRLIDESLER
jgi:hypothetical protein